MQHFKTRRQNALILRCPNSFGFQLYVCENMLVKNVETLFNELATSSTGMEGKIAYSSTTTDVQILVFLNYGYPILNHTR